MQKNKATSPEKKAALESIRVQFKGTDRDTQRERLLHALLMLSAVSTYEARQELDIYYPPSQVKELRDEGYRINMLWQVVTTSAGIDHRVGLYVLESGVRHATA